MLRFRPVSICMSLVHVYHVYSMYMLIVMKYAASAPARGEVRAQPQTEPPRVCGWSRGLRMVRMDLAQHASTGGYPRARPCCLLSKPANVVLRASPERLGVHSARDWSKRLTCGFQGDPPRIARRIPLQMAPHHRRACARSLYPRGIQLSSLIWFTPL